SGNTRMPSLISQSLSSEATANISMTPLRIADLATTGSGDLIWLHTIDRKQNSSKQPWRIGNKLRQCFPMIPVRSFMQLLGLPEGVAPSLPPTPPIYVYA